MCTLSLPLSLSLSHAHTQFDMHARGKYCNPTVCVQYVHCRGLELGGTLGTCPYQYPATTKLSQAIFWSNN